jgi:hypothetical protein
MKEEVKEILNQLNERINSKYIVYVEKRGIGVTEKRDIKIILLKNMWDKMVQASWYRNEKDYRNDVARDGMFKSEQEFYNSGINYYKVYFEEVSLEKLTKKNRNLPVEQLKDVGVVEKEWDWGKVEGIEKWLERNNNYTILMRGEGVLTKEELGLKVFDWNL